MKLNRNIEEKLKIYLLLVLKDNELVSNIFQTIKLHNPPLDKEVLVKWQSDWAKMNQTNPWFAKIAINGSKIKRMYLDCSSEYLPAMKNVVRKSIKTNIRIGTIVEYVTGGNSRRKLQYFGIITKFGIYQLGEIEDNSTLLNFLSTYNNDVLVQITEEHELFVEQ